MSTPQTNTHLPPHALSPHPLMVPLAQLAQSRDHQIVLVGGAVRDACLEHLSQDRDPTSVTGAHLWKGEDWDWMVLRKETTASVRPDVEGLSKAVAEAFHGRYVLLDPHFGIHRVILFQDQVPELTEKTLVLDFTEAQNNDLENDLARRDFTLNAMAWDPLTETLFDPHGGYEDLFQRTLRMISAQNLEEDPLRILRVYRFAAQLAGKKNHPVHLDPDTMAFCHTHFEKLSSVAPERIHGELFKMVSQPHCFQALELMAQSGFLEWLFPEMTPMRKVPPNNHHHLGLFEHTLELVKQAELWIHKFPEEIQGHLNEPYNGSVKRVGLVKLACLFHDLGKPDTWVIQPNGRHTFYTHEQVSEKMCEPIRQRLKIGHDPMDYIKRLVRWHLYPCQFGPHSPRKSIQRFFRRMGEDTWGLLLLAVADRMSTLGPAFSPEDIDRSVQGTLWLATQYGEERQVLSLPPLLNGNDIMNLLGLSPGPHLKTYIEALTEAHQAGEISTPEAAQAFLLKWHGENSQGATP